jgi:hypothetical protein
VQEWAHFGMSVEIRGKLLPIRKKRR